MSRRGVVFLMYHELEIPGRALCRRESGYRRYVVTEKDFRVQVGWLHQAGWHGLNISEALAFVSHDEANQNEVVFTFDDGCETDLMVAAPILKEAGFGATFYITLTFLGQRGFMNPSQLRQLSGIGFEIGCHSMTHAYLTELDDLRLCREMVDAKTQLEEILGKPVEHFSCPGGRYDARSVHVARDAGYRSVANSSIQVNTPGTDKYELGRIAVLRQTALPTFQQLCDGEGIWKLRLRSDSQNVARKVLGNSLYDRARALLLRDE